MKVIYKFLLLCHVCMLSGFAHAEVKALVNQATVYQGDPITLTIQSDKNNNAEPGLSPLQKDFLVQGSSTSSQINIINGSRSFRKTWSIELQPRISGNITIPEITVGSEKTKPVDVTIKELPPEVAAETSKHIFIESSVELENGETYVQQQIPYTVKLFYDSAMQNGEVFSPQIENANIRGLGADKKYQVVRGGKKYRVVEKRFVISPEKSGQLLIPPTVVKGRIALSGGDSKKLRQRMDETEMLNHFFNGFNQDPFFQSPFNDMFSRRSIGPSRPFSVSSEAINVNVLPVPESFKGSAWLPAEDVIMTDSWATSPPELKVGEPVTRQLTLQVKGLASSQIPEIKIPKPIGIKVYPEQAKTETPTDGNTVYGIQRIDISYIPSQAGKVIIPEINVDWWDVNKKQQKTFTLPEWSLSVAPGVLGMSEPDIAAEPESELESESEQFNDENLGITPSYWGWEIIAALLFVLLGSLFLFYRAGRRYQNSRKRLMKKTNKAKQVDLEALKSSLLKACIDNDKQTTARLLLELVNAQWEANIQNLGALAGELCHGSNIVSELEQALYAEGVKSWNGEKLRSLVLKGLIQKTISTTSKPEGLAPLYPT